MDGGTYNWDSSLSGASPYNMEVVYTCGKGRRFRDPINVNRTYYEFRKKCTWEQTWFPTTNVRMNNLLLSSAKTNFTLT